MGIKAERQLELHSPLGDEGLLRRQLHGAEQLGTYFEQVLSLYSKNLDLEPNNTLGAHAKSAHKPPPGVEKLSVRKWERVPASIWGW